jgi:hypothetical protein
MEKVMSLIRNAQRIGAAAAVLAGLCGAAAAQTSQTPTSQTPISQTHVMTVPLPGGGVAEIRYAGAVAPQVFIDPAPAAALPAFFGAGSPFAEFDRVAAAMDREADRMFREAAALAANPAALTPAALGSLPPGSREYTAVSTMAGDRVCSRSVEIISQGNGAPPRVVTHTSGDCGPAGPGVQVPTQVTPAPAPSHRPQMIMTRSTAPRLGGARIEEASLN